MFSRIRKFSLPLLILIILILTGVLARGSAAQGNIDQVLDLKITKLSAEPVPVGESARYGVELRNVSGQGIQNIIMRINWETLMVSDAKMRVVAEETVDVRTDAIRREAGMVAWKGDMKAGGVLAIEIELTPALCSGDDRALTLTGEAGRAGSQERIDALTSMMISCAYDLNPNDLNVMMAFDQLPPLGVFGAEADVLAGQPAHVQIQVKNTSDGRINALIGVEIIPKEGMEEQCLLLPAVQQRISGAPTVPVANAVFGTDTFTYGYMALEIDPGATWQADLKLIMRGRTMGCEFSGETAVFAGPAIPIPGSCKGESPECRYEGWSPREKDVQALVDWLLEQKSEVVTARLVSPDLGDAPASENHFNIGMPPYGAGSGTANFPTVFNFNIGMPPAANQFNMEIPGPYHRESRPLRLGALVTVERDADLNPGRNIDPETGASNLDRRDDSLTLDKLPGDCDSLDLSVPLTVEESAVHYFEDSVRTAYLNVFVDANGDGDWADAGQCAGETAPEHVLINYPVDVAALGVGRHMITLPANKGVPWDSTNHTWLRITIADEKAPTPLNSGGIAHGDGRGPAAGYLLGETEDYRLRVGSQTNATAQGADLALRLDGQITVLANPHMLAGPSIQATDWLTHTTMVFNHLLRFGNLGETAAPGSKLVVMPDPALRDGEIDLSLSAELPWREGLDYTAKCDPADPDCRVEIDLGNVPPGAFGTVNVTVTAHCAPDSGSVCKKTALVTKAIVNTAGDDDGSNNKAQKAWALPLPGEWLAPPVIDFPIPGTSGNDELEVRGVAWPERKVIVGVNGKKAGEDGDKDGPWKVTLEPGDGSQQIAATFETPGGGANPSAPVSVVMKGGSTMIIDPLSMRVGLQHGGDQLSAIPWSKNGRLDPEGWQLPLITGTTAEITVEPSSWVGCLTCTLPIGVDAVLQPLTATLRLDSGQLLTTLTASESDKTMRGSFAVNNSMINKPVSLNVFFEGVEQVYRGRTSGVGALPKVVDAASGQPLKDALVVLWQRAVDGDDFLVWQRNAVVNGQPNPRVTGADGSFFFDVAPGVYRLEIIPGDGSPSLWTEPQRTFGIFVPGRTYMVNSDQASALKSAAAAADVVSISADGFSPPSLVVNQGAVIEFQNLDLLDRGLQAADPAPALTGVKAGQSASSLIPSGGRLRIKFSQPGSYEYEDPQDPQNRMTVLVQPGGGSLLYLPVVMAKDQR